MFILLFLPLLLSIPTVINPISDQTIKTEEEFTFLVPDSTFSSSDGSTIGYSITSTNDKLGYFINDPKLLTSYFYLHALDICVQQNYTFVAGGYYGVAILDTSNLTNPILLTTISPETLHDDAHSITVDGIFLYIGINYKSSLGNDEGFKIFNISNPTSPIRIGHSEQILNTGSAYGTKRIISRGNIVFYAYQEFTGYFSYKQNFLQIYNVSNPSSPLKIGEFEIHSPSSGDNKFQINDFYVDQKLEYVYLVEGKNGLRILDIHEFGNLTTPVSLSRIVIPGGRQKANSVVVDENLNIAYVGVKWLGLAIVNITDKKNPKILNIKEYNNGVVSIHLLKNSDKLIFARENKKMVMVNRNSATNVSFPSSIEWVDDHEKNPATRFATDESEKQLFITAGVGGVRTYDISTISSPKYSGEYNPDGAAYNMIVSNHTLYVKNMESGLRTFDVRNRKNIVETSHIHLVDSSVSEYDDILLSEDRELLFLTMTSTGFHIIDISDRLHPKIITSMSLDAQALTVFKDLMIGLDDEYFRIYNISDPKVPVKIGEVPSKGYKKDILVVYNDSTVYMSRKQELHVLDIRNLTNPSFMSRDWEIPFKSPFYVYGMSLDESDLYIAKYQIGVLDLKSNISRPNITFFTDDYKYTPAYGLYGGELKNGVLYVYEGNNGWYGMTTKDMEIVSQPGEYSNDVKSVFSEHNFVYSANEYYGFKIYRGELKLFEKKYFCGNLSIQIDVFDGSGETSTSFDVIREGSQCSGHGECNWDKNECECSPNFAGGKCEILKCDCSGHGVCTDWGMCACEDGYFGVHCSVTKCHGIFSNVTAKVCSNHGECWDKSCKCKDEYFGEYCNITTCSGYFNNDTSSQNILKICRGHGICEVFDDCKCSDILKYSGSDCEVTSCNNISSDASVYLVCNGHGKCLDFNDCDCFEELGYTGDFCEYPICFGIGAHNKSVCGGHGSCLSKDKCSCLFGYSSSSSKRDGICDVWYCNGIEHYDSRVCSSRGDCVDYNKCVCRKGFHSGQQGDCESWNCGGFDRLDRTNVCSGNGDCEVKEDGGECECEGSFAGENCETNVVLLSVLTPLAGMGVIGGIGLVFICLILGCVCVMICSCFGVLLVCCFLICVCCCSVCLCCVVVKQGWGMRKYKKLKNFDLLLKEQELEEDVSIAHLKISKNLFEVQIGEIKTIRVLGEGGSNSIVFEADWRNQRVAFKCFKTRSVCTNQDSFDEFETEVGLLSSLAHPHIIRFFGACLNPPRVGILMEFCPNGEMLQFVQKFREKHEMVYPIYEKFRLLREITSALNYIHSRNIIHRDLKSENVLISDDDRCKLMDFGLSRLVESMSIAKTVRIGTSSYMAPEIVLSTDYSEKCDIFSLGILTYVICVETEKPYGKRAEMNLEIRVANSPNFRPNLSVIETEDEEKIPLKVRKPLMRLIKKCWDHDPKARYSSDQILKIFEELSEFKSEEKVEREKEGGDSSSSVFSSSEEEEESGLKGKNVELEEEVLELRKEMEKMREENEKYRKKIEKLEKQLE